MKKLIGCVVILALLGGFSLWYQFGREKPMPTERAELGKDYYCYLIDGPRGRRVDVHSQCDLFNGKYKYQYKISMKGSGPIKIGWETLNALLHNSNGALLLWELNDGDEIAFSLVCDEHPLIMSGMFYLYYREEDANYGGVIANIIPWDAAASTFPGPVPHSRVKK